MQDVDTLANLIFEFFITKTIDRLNVSSTARLRNKLATDYKKFDTYFSKIAKVCIVANIDYIDYVQYVFKTTPANYRVWPKRLCNVDTIKKYAEEKDIEKQYEKIISYFKKTFDFIESQSKTLNLSMPAYFKQLVFEKKLINYVISGQISGYWLSTLGKNNLIKILNSIDDPSSKITFGKLVEKSDMYFSAVSSAYFKKFGKKINPFKFD